MGRWRPPAEKGTALVTREGHERLKAEIDDLWRVRRPEVVRALAAAAAEGDRSENAEYSYRKKQLGEIDRRVRPDETDAKRGWISIDSPLARALLKKRIDDEVEAQLPGGPRRYVIVAVAYATSP